MRRKLIIDGNAVYEIDEDCMLKRRRKEKEKKEKENGNQKANRAKRSCRIND